MQLASRNPFLRTACCWLGNFLQGFLGHSLQNALWLSPTPLQNFHGTFAKKNTYPQTPAISKGRIKGKANGPWCLLWQSLAFGSLAAAFGLCFLRLQKWIPMSTRNQICQNYSRNNAMIISVQGTALYDAPIYCTYGEYFRGVWCWNPGSLRN